MAFEPTLTQPDLNSIWWIHTSRGGMNKCIIINSGNGSVLANCTGYAWGRFSEIMGEQCTLCCGHAGTWFSYTADGYERGHVPCEGAVLCLGQEGSYGHVMIVEQVNPDGSIITSESGYEASRAWWTSTRKPPTYLTNKESKSKYFFQGFIYNPAVQQKTPLELFIEAAEAQINQDGSWTRSTTGISSGQAWSAAFIVACAKSVYGLINIIIPNTYSCSGVGRIGVLRSMGEWLKGPGQGEYPEPKIGDLVCFRRSSYGKVNTYQSDHCGIVSQTSGNTMTVIEGDCSGYVRQNTYNTGSWQITGYFRPDWERVNTADEVEVAYRNVQGLYTSMTTKHDAAVKEVGYLDGNMKPSIFSSKIKLSILNYTGLLGNLYSVFGGTLATSDASNTSDQSTVRGSVSGTSTNELPEVSIDGLTQKEAVCFTYFMNHGLNAAASCGILGNIKAESNFRTDAVGDNGTSFGICQWHNNRGRAMQNMAGADWRNNLTGQLDYLWSELNSGYKDSTLVPLMGVSNDINGAMRAADIFVRNFEKPAAVDAASKRRQTNAVNYFNKVITQV